MMLAQRRKKYQRALIYFIGGMLSNGVGIFRLRGCVFGIDQAMPDRILDEAGKVVRIHLLHDVGLVSARCLHAEKKLLRDLGYPFSLNQKEEYLVFAV
jgi:hypothetical protein